MAKITINGITIDPKVQERSLIAFKLDSADASKSDFILIQTTQPLDKIKKDELNSMSVEILEYVPENTYICDYKPIPLDHIRSLAYVEWANVYLSTFKIPPALLGLSIKRTPSLSELMPKPYVSFSFQTKEIDVVLHRGVVPSTILDKVASAAMINRSEMKTGRNKLRLKIKLNLLQELAKIDEVRHIEEVQPLKLHNDIARKVLRLETDTENICQYMGENQIVAVADTGLDKGSATDIHPALMGRVKKIYALGRTDQADDPNGHGTHVAGSILSEGDSQILRVTVRGTAPKVKLIFQSLLDSIGDLGGIPNELQDLFAIPYENDNARVHSNSWGVSNNEGKYNQNCWEVDDFVWNHRDMVICFSAGNDGTDDNGNGQIDPGSISAPAAAKNCISVGASENLRPNFLNTYGEWWPMNFRCEPIASDKLSDNCEGMAAFSSRGPTNDGRIKPDVVAPGTFILSTRSSIATDKGWELSKDPLYYFMGGTSMATPLVAGCSALVREYLIKVHNIQSPSAALVKAMLINGARDIAGQYVPSESGSLPNHSVGFGLINMSATLVSKSLDSSFVLRDENEELETGEEEKFTILVPAKTHCLKVTLVWTDPTGESLQNDLDLIVKDRQGNETHGNGRLGINGFDRVNNIEQVIWDHPSTGKFEITVRAYRITKYPQTYALVARCI